METSGKETFRIHGFCRYRQNSFMFHLIYCNETIYMVRVSQSSDEAGLETDRLVQREANFGGSSSAHSEDKGQAQ